MLETLNEIMYHQQIGFPVLSIIIFLPVLSAFIICFIDRKNIKVIQQVAVFAVAADFILSLMLLGSFKVGVPDMQFVENVEWIKAIGTSYHVGIDGISLFLILLTTFIGCIVMAYLVYVVPESDKLKDYTALILSMQTCVLGVFCALDLILFYIFWELVLIPIYFLIKMYGSGNRTFAALKFFLFTLVGGVLMLLGIIAIFYNYHTFALANNLPKQYTFNVIELFSVPVPESKQFLIFMLFFIGLAVKVPIFPLHTWLPDTYTQAPLVGTIFLSALLSKMGVYGFLRFSLPLLPNASHSFVRIGCMLAVIGTVYAAWAAFSQSNIKRLIAYSSISHLGFMMLGVFSLNAYGIEGTVIQMFNHGITIAALFLLGGILYERRGTFEIEEFGGLFKHLPRLAFFFPLFVFASMGLPGLNSFVGELFILVGAFKNPDVIVFAVLAGIGLVSGLAYSLWTYQRVVLGNVTNPVNKEMKDLSNAEMWCLIPLAALVFWIGLYPTPFLDRIKGSADFLGARLESSVKVVKKEPRITRITLIKNLINKKNY